MPIKIVLFLLLGIFSRGIAQTNSYSISFPNAVHHEAVVTAIFPQLQQDTLEVYMGRSSPGRYALHEFAKNVYGFRATDSNGNPLQVQRANPYSWKLSGHDGVVRVEYILFANRGDGTYSQIDETHAHLNIPATFMFAPALKERPIEVSFNLREDLGWKIATQLPLKAGTTHTAPNLQYFMDSPTELSAYSKREFTVASDSREYVIEFVLHHQGSEASLDIYFEKVKKVVTTQQKVFGELPAFDYGRYTFLACYMPQVSGDGMEHRNSTVLTSTSSLEAGGIDGNISTVSHEFFHSWNVERLRPASLEPFDFTKANMSGELWFAEGFTSYYTDLILCRAGIIGQDDYVSGLNGGFNYVWTLPGRKFHNPVEMSYQAPFVDAASSIDPHNTANIFISYYTYGKMLGLALDLSLRQHKLSLDGFMKKLWNTYGRKELPYTLTELQESLESYAGHSFASQFFGEFIYDSKMPDYSSLFQTVGIELSPEPEGAYLGPFLSHADGEGVSVQGNTLIDSPAYKAGLEKDDLITVLNGRALTSDYTLTEALATLKPGDSIHIDYRRRGQEARTMAILQANPAYTIQLLESMGLTPSDEALSNRKSWLNPE